MQCQYCGSNNRDGAKFCVSCGAALSVAPAAPPPAAPAPAAAPRPLPPTAAQPPAARPIAAPPAPPAPAAPRKRRLLPFILGGAALLLVCLVAVGVAAYLFLFPRTATIAYIVNSDEDADPGLYLMDGDGENVRLLVPIEMDEEYIISLAWSPDGKSIAYELRDDTGLSSIWIVEVKTGDTTRLVDDLDNDYFDVIYLDWSPDSRQIAYTAGGDEPEIYIVDVDSGDETRLADGGVPFWSPDGDTIAFTLILEDEDVYEALLIRPDGSGETTLLAEDETRYVPFGWSPDSRTILVMVTDPEYTWDILLISPDGEDEFNLTDSDDESDLFPAYSPDGRWIAYFLCDDSSGDCELTIIRPDGSERQSLGTLDSEASFSWSPDSRALLYATEDGEIIRVDIDTRQETSLSDEIDSLIHPAFAP